MTRASKLLRVGVQLPEVERYVPWSEYAAIARAAEEAGFDSIWVGDHLLYRGDDRLESGPWDGWTLLSALAATTERVQLGPLVACSAFRNPGILARTVAAVNEVSGGRLILAIGAGWNEVEFQAFGIPFDHRASRFPAQRAAAQIIKHFARRRHGRVRCLRNNPYQRPDYSQRGNRLHHELPFHQCIR